ncbi:MAG: CHAP domain-containing protein [Paludibacter sp.]
MKKETKRLVFIITALFVLVISGFWIFYKDKHEHQTEQAFGSSIDSYNGVTVFYNGNSNGYIKGRNITNDGYNLGLKYQCVEFVKRYYYEYLHHKMPNSHGNAKDFYNKSLMDGHRNLQRDLIQYRNPSKTKPKVNDLIIFAGNKFNPFGHVAIISKVADNEIEIVQQNTGSTRATLALIKNVDGWKVTGNSLGWAKINCLGWLRKE